jgi:hypothetical protein
MAACPIPDRVVSSCQRHGHYPFVYLRDVLTRLPNHPNDRLEELLPNRWTPSVAADAMCTAVSSIATGSVD